MLILTIVQNFAKLPHLKSTFLETSYLSVFGLCRPMIYRPDGHDRKKSDAALQNKKLENHTFVL